jgi:hypothetical protein
VTLRDALQSELAAAMQRRDRPVVTALRTTLSQLANAEAVPTPADVDTTKGSQHVAGATGGLGATEAQRATLSEDQVRAIVIGERIELLVHAERLTKMCRRDEADGVRRAADTIAALLAPGADADPPI